VIVKKLFFHKFRFIQRKFNLSHESTKCRIFMKEKKKKLSFLGEFADAGRYCAKSKCVREWIVRRYRRLMVTHAWEVVLC